jgi:sugar lactone lactonase YvrE
MKRLTTLPIALLAVFTLTLPTAASSFPDVVPLPNGIAPEGIAIGSGPEFFTGSLLDGAIYKGDLRTGDGDFINVSSDFSTARAALGMKHDPRSDVLWVAGGPFGQGYVYDADTGDTIASIQLTTAETTFVNDVVVTRTAGYFTDSFQPVIYKQPLDSRGLPAGQVETLPLTGDFEFISGAFNANGIDATPDGKTLVLVNSATGAIYAVDPETGRTTAIDLGGSAVPNGDGILLDGRILYVVQNFFNQIGVVHLSPDLASGVVSDSPITSPDFRIPTTTAEFGNALYAVNARFDVTPGPGVEYEVVRVAKG